MPIFEYFKDQGFFYRNNFDFKDLNINYFICFQEKVHNGRAKKYKYLRAIKSNINPPNECFCVIGIFGKTLMTNNTSRE